MKMASAMPRMSEPTRALPRMIATPQSATTLAIMVRKCGTSRNQTQASAAVTKGPVAMMIATLDTLVSCRAGMKASMAAVEYDATSQPLFPIRVSSRRPARPCNSTIMAAINPPPNSPRQNRMVQES